MATTFPLNRTKVQSLRKAKAPVKRPRVTYDTEIFAEAREMENDGIEIHSLLCCGGKEINYITGYHGMSTDILVANIIHAMFNDISDQYYRMSPGILPVATARQKKYLPAFFLFTDVASDDATSVGEQLAEFINDNNLGSVISSTPNKNNNSGNLVEGFLWAVDRDRVVEWWNKKGRFYIN